MGVPSGPAHTCQTRARPRGTVMSVSGSGSVRRPTLGGAFVALLLALLLPSTALGATGDLSFSRLSGLSSADDQWNADSSHGTAVYTGGYTGTHAVLRRYSRSGQTIWTRVVPLKT